MTTTAAPALDRGALLDRFRRLRARTRALFDVLDEAVYFERPIALRNPVVFYEGHLPGFAVNTLIKKALGQPGIDARLETIFARGIDPASEADAVARGNPAWPDRAAVRAYAAAADRLIEEAIQHADLDRPGHPLLDRAQALRAILEHEEMHQETLAYMWHQVPYALKRKPAGYVTAIDAPGAPIGGARMTIPGGLARLGTSDDEPFAWDNERPAHTGRVAAFVVDADNVTNEDFLEFVRAGGYAQPQWWRAEDFAWVSSDGVSHPAFWEREDDAWYWRGMFERIPLPGRWPVYVTWAEAQAYVAWRGARLMTEAEYQRAAEGTGIGNADFERWDPEPVAMRPASVSVHGVRDLAGNGWEWTASPFAPFDGFVPLPSYPEYSADFFDEEHFVMKGASPVTARELIRPGFRNWFRPRYPYTYATFRCATGTGSARVRGAMKTGERDRASDRPARSRDFVGAADHQSRITTHRGTEAPGTEEDVLGGGVDGVTVATKEAGGGASAAHVRDHFAADVAEYLRRTPKQLPSKYFYDELGSSLFEAICRLPWYRITRAETALLERHAAAVVAPLGGAIDVAELGCGSGEKLATLLRSAGADVGRIQLIDISPAALEMASAQARTCTTDVIAHHGTYETGLAALARHRNTRPLLLLFLGSNIGNFEPAAASALLRQARAALRLGDALLLGADLVKPETDLLLAYDDPLQVTAAFNRNLLRRINDELGGRFDLASFAHRACWNAAAGRVEMHLVSQAAQRVAIERLGLAIDFAAGETIWTESSYKYEPARIVADGTAAGFAAAEQWIDAASRFSLTRFTV